MVLAFIVVTLLASSLMPFFKVKVKVWLSMTAIICNIIISTFLAIKGFSGDTYEYAFNGSIITGAIPLRIDALSGWFIMIINFIFLAGSFYGLSYLQTYAEKKNQLSLHGMAFILLHASLVSLCVIQNSFVFMIAWEIMVFSAFICVIFENEKALTIKAGINYLIQSHVGFAFIMLGFIWVAIKTGSYDFNAIKLFSQNQHETISLALFISFFVGFAIKAGFIPFHTWLPHAHPAAPSHISGIMSGVIIKIGIFGILRVLLLMKLDYVTVAYFILTVSVLSGLYGVMLAIIQHNLKKLLAYHSIENIGIIGIGIGIGCMGIGIQNHTMAFLGFAGALLHVWNHALFKSLLFFTAGNVYQAYHTMDIEKLGGVVKKMPQTSILFLIAAIAICGLPPFNGFVSEFIIYSGFYVWLQNAGASMPVIVIFSILSLVLIGGLAMLCFTKAFGVSFLGNNRQDLGKDIKEVDWKRLMPLYFIGLFILLIGLFPQIFLEILHQPVSLFSKQVIVEHMAIPIGLYETMKYISLSVWAFIVLVALVFLLKKYVQSMVVVDKAATWGCGYLSPTSKIQYTASSFVRSYTKLFRFVLLIFQKEKELVGAFPGKSVYESHPYDRIEKSGIDTPIRNLKAFFARFLFLQNGKLQVYILYGIIFIILTIAVPLIYLNIEQMIDFFKQL